LPDDVEKRKYTLIAYLKDQASEQELERVSSKFGIEPGSHQGLRSQTIYAISLWISDKPKMDAMAGWMKEEGLPNF